jgi:hypothetical protein
MTWPIARRQPSLLQAAILAVFAAIGIMSAATWSAQPRNDRTWQEEYVRPPRVTLSGDAFHIAPIGDWRYAPQGAVQKTNETFDAKLADAVRIWYVVGLTRDGALAGHTFLLFEFRDHRLIGASVEARLEARERYYAPLGALNAYEIFYAWGSAHDVLTRRAVFLHRRLWIYPLALDAPHVRAALEGMLRDTEGAARHPRFYNTFTANCTSELYRRIGAPWHYSAVLTGLSADYLLKRGLIADGGFAPIKAQADMAAFIRDNSERTDRDFDAALLRELGRRFP